MELSIYDVQNTAQPPELQRGGGLGDAARAAGSTAAGIGASAMGLLGDTGIPVLGSGARIAQNYLNDIKETALADMSPKNRTAIEASPLSKEFWQAPFRSAGMQLAGMAPYIAAAPLLPEGAIGGVLGGAAFGLESVGEARSETRRQIIGANDAALQQAIPYYKQLRDQGVPEFDAKEQTIRSARDSTEEVRSGLANAVAGIGFLGAGRGVAARGLRGAAQRAGIGAVELGATQPVASAMDEYNRQSAEVRLGQRATIDPDVVAEAAAAGALSGGALGGVMGLLHRPRQPQAKAPGTGADTGRPSSGVDPTLAAGATGGEGPLPGGGGVFQGNEMFGPLMGYNPNWNPAANRMAQIEVPRAPWRERFGDTDVGVVAPGAPGLDFGESVFRQRFGGEELPPERQPWRQPGMEPRLDTTERINWLRDQLQRETDPARRGWLEDQLARYGRPELTATETPRQYPALQALLQRLQIQRAYDEVRGGPTQGMAAPGPQYPFNRQLRITQEPPSAKRARAEQQRGGRPAAFTDEGGGEHRVFPDGSTQPVQGGERAPTIYVSPEVGENIRSTHNHAGARLDMEEGQVATAVLDQAGNVQSKLNLGPFTTEPRRGLVPVQLHGATDQGFQRSTVGPRIANTVARGRAAEVRTLEGDVRGQGPAERPLSRTAATYAEAQPGPGRNIPKQAEPAGTATRPRAMGGAEPTRGEPRQAVRLQEPPRRVMRRNLRQAERMSREEAAAETRARAGRALSQEARARLEAQGIHVPQQTPYLVETEGRRGVLPHEPGTPERPVAGWEPDTDVATARAEGRPVVWRALPWEMAAQNVERQRQAGLHPEQIPAREREVERGEAKPTRDARAEAARVQRARREAANEAAAKETLDKARAENEQALKTDKAQLKRLFSTRSNIAKIARGALEKSIDRILGRAGPGLYAPDLNRAKLRSTKETAKARAAADVEGTAYPSREELAPNFERLWFMNRLKRELADARTAAERTEIGTDEQRRRETAAFTRYADDIARVEKARVDRETAARRAEAEAERVAREEAQARATAEAAQRAPRPETMGTLLIEQARRRRDEAAIRAEQASGLDRQRWEDERRHWDDIVEGRADFSMYQGRPLSLPVRTAPPLLPRAIHAEPRAPLEPRRLQTEETSAEPSAQTAAEQQAEVEAAERATGPTQFDETQQAKTFDVFRPTTAPERERAEIEARYEGARTGRITRRVGEEVRSAVTEVMRRARTFADRRVAQQINRVFAKLHRAIVNVPIHIMSDEEFAGMKRPGTLAFYGERRGERGIYVPHSTAISPEGAQIILHEASHAATSDALDAPQNHQVNLDMAQLGRLTQLAISADPDILRRYNFDDVQAIQVERYHDPHEFLAEAHSNGGLQRFLMDTPMPAEMARRLNLPRQSLWDAMMTKIGRMFGLTKAERNMMDAVLRATDELASYDPGHGNLKRRRTIGEILDDTRPDRFHPMVAGTIDRKIAEARAALPHGLAGNLHWLRRNAAKIVSTRGFNPMAIRAGFDRINERGDTHVHTITDQLARMGAEAGEIVDRYVKPVRDKAERLASLYSSSGKFADMQNIMHDATMFQVHPHLPIEVQTQLRRRSVRDADGKIMRDSDGKRMTEIDPLANAQALDKWQALSKQWNDLPQELRDFVLNDQQPMLRRLHDDTADQLVANNIAMMADVPAADRERLKNSILDGTLADEEANNYQSSVLLQELRDHPALKKLAVYSPLYRNGDYVLHGQYHIETPRGSSKVADDTFRFDSEEEARAFAAKQGVKVLKAGPVYLRDGSPFKPGTEKRLTRADWGRGEAEQKFQVQLQTKHMEMFNSYAEAHRRYDEMRNNDVGLTLNAPENKRWQMPELSRAFMSHEWQGAINRMKLHPDFQAKAPAVQDFMERMMVEQSLMAMGSTRIQSSRLPRRYVMGASPEMVSAIGRYGLNYAGYLSRLRHMPAIDAAMKSLEEERKAKANDKPELVSARAAILDELQRRIYDPRQPERDSFMHNMFSRLLQFSYLDKLASPAFHMINAAEPWTLYLPTVAGRHGMGRSAAALKQMYEDLGGLPDTAMRGAKDMVAAWKGKDIEAYTKGYKERLRGTAYGDEIVAGITDMEKLGLIGDDAGMELARRMDPSSHAALRFMDRLDRSSRQMGQAIESINRTVVYGSAYRLEKTKLLREGMREGLAREKAHQYALDKVYETMGDYGAWNMPRIFNHPLGRMALQFKKYGQKTYQLLAMNGAAMLRGDREARKAFIGVLASHALLAGTLGLPLEALRGSVMIANAFGLTGDTNYADIERWWRETLVDALGPDGGEIAARGLPRWAGIDLQRVGLDNLFLPMGEPKGNTVSDLTSYIAQFMLGAPGSMALEYPQAVSQVLRGDTWNGLSRLVPFKAGADAITAVLRMNQGKLTPGGKQAMDPYTIGEAFTRALGFTPGREAELNDARSFIQHEKAKRTKTRREEIADWIQADTPEQRQHVWEQIQENNQYLPPIARLTLEQLSAAEYRRLRDRTSGRDQWGIQINRNQQDILRDARRYYNLQ